MREEERFEKENISRESCQEPRDPSQDPFQDPSQDSQGSLEQNSQGSLKQSRLIFQLWGGVSKLINQRLGLRIPTDMDQGP